MIGSGLKKLAEENGLKVGHGVAYGVMRGFNVTLKDGPDQKILGVNTSFRDPEAFQQFQTVWNNQREAKLKEYQLLRLDFFGNGFLVVFRDKIGTMDRIRAFLDWFFPLLTQYRATSAGICTCCGAPIGSEGVWKLYDGVAMYLHPACAEQMKRALLPEEEVQTGPEVRTKKESYLLGAVGALLGGLLGAGVWGLVSALGFVLSLIGVLIGFLTEKGYDLLKGKQGKGKLPILIAVSVLSVILGTFLGYLFTVMKEAGYPFLQSASLTLYLVIFNSEMRLAVLKDLALGLLFAGLGLFGMFYRVGKQTHPEQRVVDLE